MMLGMESVTALYVGGWCWCRSAGDQFLQWRVGRRHQAVTRHCATTAEQSHAALMLHSHMTSSIGSGF